MNVRENAAKIATQFEGRCTCAAMDGGVDCPWCQVFYDMLQGYPVTPPPARCRAEALAHRGLTGLRSIAGAAGGSSAGCAEETG